MFHAHSGLFFGRKANGDVRIIKLSDKGRVGEEWPKADGEYPDAELDITLQECSWCSAIASVCRDGETGETYEKAKAFHGVTGC